MRLISLGLALVVCGLLQELRKKETLLTEVARDNMALRFHIHETEVEKNA